MIFFWCFFHENLTKVIENPLLFLVPYHLPFIYSLRIKNYTYLLIQDTQITLWFFFDSHQQVDLGIELFFLLFYFFIAIWYQAAKLPALSGAFNKQARTLTAKPVRKSLYTKSDSYQQNLWIQSREDMLQVRPRTRQPWLQRTYPGILSKSLALIRAFSVYFHIFYLISGSLAHPAPLAKPAMYVNVIRNNNS